MNQLVGVWLNNWFPTGKGVRSRELCESRSCRPGLPVPNKPDGFYGRKATSVKEEAGFFAVGDRVLQSLLL